MEAERLPFRTISLPAQFAIVGGRGDLTRLAGRQGQAIKKQRPARLRAVALRRPAPRALSRIAGWNPSISVGADGWSRRPQIAARLRPTGLNRDMAAEAHGLRSEFSC